MENKDFIALLTECEQKLQNYHIPRFNELPNFGLYMDQVVGYVNQMLNIFDEPDANLITPSMINNYVKHGIIPPPNGKKYSNVHLAYICAVYFLKQVLSMDEIKNAIAHQISCNNTLGAYTYFCDGLEQAFKSCCLLTKTTSQPSTTADDETKYVLKTITISIANLTYAQKVIALQAQKEDAELSEEEKREQKEQEKQRKKEEKKKDKKTKK